MGIHVSPLATSPPHSAAASHVSNNSGQDSDSGLTPSSTSSRQNEIIHSGENQDGLPTPGTASTHFDFSPSTLDQLPEEEQEMNRVEGLGSPSEVLGEEERGAEGPARCHEDPLNWQRLVSREVLAGLAPQEIKRQEVLNELLYTERAHLRMLKVLDCVFYQRLSRDGILPLEDIRHIFANLEEILQLHGSITEQMATIRNNSETSVIGNIGDDLLAWFGGEEEEKFKRAVGTFCSNQPSALELIKTRQKKEQRFTSFMQEAESNRLCRRLQLKDIIPVEMQRLTKYPLLLENIAKYTEDAEERDKVKQAAECCRQILNYVNQAVKEAENKQRLEDYQRRLDLSSLKQSENPMILEFKNLDLTKGKMVHEGPLSWKVNKDKTIELYTILLEDVLVLLQKQDERLVLKCHSKNLAGTADTKHIFSPIIKLNAVLVRSVATDNKSFFVISMSDNGAQIYELMAQTVSEQRTWQRLVTQCAEAMKVRLRSVRPLAQTDTERDTIEIINTGMSNPSGDPHCTSTGITRSPDKDNPSPPSLGALPTTSTNPFEGLESDDEGEGLAVTDRVEEEEEEEEADEDELEAFLDGELADRLPLLRERSRQGFAINSQEHAAFSLPSFRADEALQTLATLKQVLLEHMTNREQEAELEKKGPPSPLCSRERAPRASSTGSSENTVGRARGEEPRAGSAELGAAERSGEKGWDLEHPPGPLELFETPKSNGRYVVLDSCVGGSESSTDDDGGGGGVGGRGPAEDMEMDPEIDLTKLLSSSSQTGGNSGDGGGPNLSRQLMTHLRLLQASLQHLKEVEVRYNQLHHTLTEMAPDSDVCNG